jgi:hypothetical protein
MPDWTMDPEVVGKNLSTLGKAAWPGLLARAREMGVNLPPELNNPDAELTPGLIVPFLRDVAGHFFPLLGGDAQDRNGARRVSAEARRAKHGVPTQT